MKTTGVMRMAALVAAALLVAAAALLVVGCPNNDSTNPQVVVKNGKIRVEPDPIQFSKDQVNVTVSWHLPPGGPLTFPDNAISFKDAAGQDEIVNCRVSSDRTTFSCLNKHTKPGKYAYGVQVHEDGKPLAPLDPQLWNF